LTSDTIEDEERYSHLMNRTDCKNPGLGSVNPIVGGGGRGEAYEHLIKTAKPKTARTSRLKEKNV
jgi:hypothetical protein